MAITVQRKNNASSSVVAKLGGMRTTHSAFCPEIRFIDRGAWLQGQILTTCSVCFLISRSNRFLR